MNGISESLKENRFNEHITKLEKLIPTVQIKGTYQQFCYIPCFMLVNFIDLLKSVALLDKNHMAVAGKIIVRTMFENLVDFLYCETNRKELYRRFGDYQYVNKVLLFESSPKEVQSIFNNEEYKNVTLPEYSNFKQKYNIKSKNELHNWSGLSIYKRVKIVSKEIPAIYNSYLMIYKVNCNYAHMSVQTLWSYATINSQEVKVDYEKEYKENHFTLIQEINTLVDIFYETFKKNYSSKRLEEIFS